VGPGASIPTGVAIVLGSWALVPSVLSPFVLGTLWTMDQDPGRTRTQARRTRTRSYTELQIALVVQVWLQWHLANCFVDRAIL